MLSEEERQRRRRAQLREQRRRAAKKRRRRALLARTLFITIIVLIITGAVCLIKHFKNAKETSAQVEPKIVENPPDRKSTRLNSSHPPESRMPSSA